MKGPYVKKCRGCKEVFKTRQYNTVRCEVCRPKHKYALIKQAGIKDAVRIGHHVVFTGFYLQVEVSYKGVVHTWFSRS
jgi:hypothetical protein